MRGRGNADILAEAYGRLAVASWHEWPAARLDMGRYRERFSSC